LVSLTQIQEVPPESIILLVGSPGSGKSAFCEQTVLQSLAIERPIIYLTTECSPSKTEARLKERGLSEVQKGLLNFIDAYNETVGVSVPDRPDTVYADCNDLSSIDIAISKLQERIGKKGILLVFDSLTSPYLFSGAEILRFMRQTLSRFAASGNAVLACMDTGCGKEEDLGAMMSLSNGVIKTETEEGKLLLNVVKHPKLRPTRIEAPTEPERVRLKPTISYDPIMFRQLIQGWFRGDEAAWRREAGDFVNLFWPNFAHWSCMLWDPKRFPTMIYELNKEDGAMIREIFQFFPRHIRLMVKLFFPNNLSKVKDIKKVVSRWKAPKLERSGVLGYLEDISKTDEHYIRIYECSDCWGLENVGTTIASHLPPMFAGICKAVEKEDRDWNAVETKCVGLGDPYCEFKLVPREIDELRSSLEKDNSIIERIHERLMHHLMGFLLEGKPLVETRPRLGSDVHLHVVFHAMGFPHVAGERYRMAQRMGGAKAGKEVGEQLIEAGISEDEAVKRVLTFLDHFEVGKVTVGETIRIRENCESLRTQLFATKRDEPCCFFTTGFLNGFFSAVKNQHVKETKCIVLGDPYCEWEFR
jgi:predicted hydrocarbon binding protein/KaiC/GvpD/RAD55 family RecA-like ATPase